MGSEIEKLRALLEAATKGPWEVDGDANGDTWGRSGSIFVGHNESKDDAALIVAAVNALPALLDVCEAAAELRIAYNGDDAELEMFAKNRLWACLSRLGGA